MGRLIRDIIENSVVEFADLPAVKWLKKKDVLEINYKSLGEEVVAVRKGLLAEGYEGKHVALIGTSSVLWIESYLGLITEIGRAHV